LIHHALHGTPQRRDAVVALASRLAAGAKPEQAVLETYGITLPELERDLQTYIRREAYSATSVEFKNAVATALPADATQADQLDVEAWLGGVQASIGRDAQALVRLEKVLTARPAHGGAHAAMASILMRQGRSSEAQTHFQAAAKANAIPRSAFQVRITGRETRPAAAPETPSPAGSANETAPAGTAAPVPTPPRNGGLILNLRNVAPGEQRTLGTLQAIECRRDGVVVVVRTPQGATRASAASMAAINFVTFRSQAAGSINCGAQPEAPALLTSRTEGERRIAVALELLPDGYVP
jgi:tetratricopeptide (TPR) repeat protein